MLVLALQFSRGDMTLAELSSAVPDELDAAASTRAWSSTPSKRKRRR
jgi:hypothetical protein